MHLFGVFEGFFLPQTSENAWRGCQGPQGMASGIQKLFSWGGFVAVFETDYEGQHAGHRVSWLDIGYLEWILREDVWDELGKPWHSGWCLQPCMQQPPMCLDCTDGLMVRWPVDSDRWVPSTQQKHRGFRFGSVIGFSGLLLGSDHYCCYSWLDWWWRVGDSWLGTRDPWRWGLAGLISVLRPESALRIRETLSWFMRDFLFFSSSVVFSERWNWGHLYHALDLRE